MVILDKLRQVLLIVFAVLAIALSISYRSGHVVPDDFFDARRATADIDPQGWKRLDTDDWLQLANQARQENQLDQAQTFTQQALASNLGSGEAMVQLALLLLHQGKQEQAIQLAELADKLATAQNSTHTYLSAFWSRTKQLDKLLDEWNVLLTRDTSISQSLYPQLQQLTVATPENTPLLDKFAKNPPTWWGSFFNFLVRDEKTPSALLSHLYELRLHSSQPIDSKEMTPYVSRLIKEQQWTEAHAVWLAGLPPEDETFKGLVYDGGFEGDMHNTGFDWFFGSHPQIDIQQELTFGMEGHRALNVKLSGPQHVNFQHVWQRLLLKPGHFELTMRFRADSFHTNKGLQWRVRCTEDNRILAESLPLHESTPWSDLKMEFDVPTENCAVQLLRLEAASSYAHEQVFTGSLWFDAIQIH